MPGADRILGRQFDVVYASVGVLPWIPDVNVGPTATCCPGGRHICATGTPFCDLDYAAATTRSSASALLPHRRSRHDGSSTATGDELPRTRVNFQWHHTLGEILGALLASGLQIQHFKNDWLGWQALDCMVQVADGHGACLDRIPLAYTVIAVRPG